MLENIYSVLKEKKPNLSQKSVHNYTSMLLRLARHVFGTEFSEETFYSKLYTRNESKAIIKYLNDHVKNLSTRKTHLAALVSCCPSENDEQKRACQLYRLNMLNDVDEFNDEMKTQEKSETQRKNWKSWENIKEIYKERGNEINYLWKKQTLTTSEYKKLMTFVLASMYVLIPPRRIMDYQLLKWTKSENSNYIHGKKLVFNQYKTSKVYKEQVVNIPNSLHTILKKWRLKNTGTYVFGDAEDKPFEQPVISKMLNKFFGKGVSVNILRHAYISDEVLKDVPDLSELEEKANSMGHSLNMQMLYRKKD